MITILGVFFLAGCHFEGYPNPNKETADMNPAVMRRNMIDLHEKLQERVDRGEISQVQKDELVLDRAQKLTEKVSLEDVEPRFAWQLADVLRQADRWEDAYTVLKIGVEKPVNEDRRVNDSLQLARVAAHLGKIEEAIDLTRSTFDAERSEKAPILLATLKEVLPEAEGKGFDLELAVLLEEAIDQHEQVVVDPDSEAGQAFLLVYPIHISEAWSKVIRLYKDNGKQEEMEQAIRRSDQMLQKYGAF